LRRVTDDIEGCQIISDFLREMRSSCEARCDDALVRGLELTGKSAENTDVAENESFTTDQLARKRQIVTEAQLALPPVLSIVYRPEVLNTRAWRPLDSRSVEVEFRFPVYTRTAEYCDHVSAAQMCEALMEGSYVTLEHAILQGSFPGRPPLEWFHRTAKDWIYLSQEAIYRKMVRVDEPVHLRCSLVKASIERFRRRMLLAVLEYDGFISGLFRICIVPPPDFTIGATVDFPSAAPKSEDE
jgi:hypothetical protein